MNNQATASNTIDPMQVRTPKVDDQLIPEQFKDMTFTDSTTVEVNDTSVEETPSRPSVPAYIRLVGWLMGGFMVLFTLAVLGGVYLYEQKVTKRVVDARPCGVTTERMALTGVREYSYLDNSLFNYHWHDRAQVDVTTRLNVPFDGLMVVAIQADTSYQVIKRDEGEGGVLILPAAHHYVFYNNGNVAAITDEAMCK